MNLNEDGDEIDVVTLMDQLTKEGTLSEGWSSIFSGTLK